ncbi:MAG TPA: ABC transporter permease [Vicinamibacteria bacterium]|nr:ABC transporter permease [Vicinamibacteria bacterium]
MTAAAAAERPDFIGLVWTLVRTDFKVRYQGTLGGFVWALLKPTSMFLVLMWVFSHIFSGNPNYGLNLLVGLFLWEFFAEGTKVGLLSLHAKGYLLTKTRFPRAVLVVTSLSNPLITLAVVSAAMLTFLGLQGRLAGPGSVALYLAYAAQLVAIVLGFSLATSVLFLRYRDLNQVWEVISHAGFFVAPIVYPLDIMPERLHFNLYLWPPTAVIEFSRAVLVEGRIPSIRGHLLLFGMSLTCLLAGSLVFRRFAPRAAEHL